MSVDEVAAFDKPIDCVLVYERPEYDSDVNENVKIKNEKLRQLFRLAMEEEHLETDEEKIGKYVFVKIHCPFERLCQEAEYLKMELPLIALDWIIKESDESKESCEEYKKKALETRMKKILDIDERSRHIIGPFLKTCRDWFTEEKKEDTLFNSSTRCLLVHSILINIDLSKIGNPMKVGFSKKQGLPYLLLKGIYLDAFILHDTSALEPTSTSHFTHRSSVELSDDLDSSLTLSNSLTTQDTRKILSKQWTSFFRKQPMDLVRDYFGEKIAFYFAWIGTLIFSLIVPTVLGVAVFLYGVITRLIADKGIKHGMNDTMIERKGLSYAIYVVTSSSDNFFTPGFAFIICIWGTIFMEVWKRKQATLAHRWLVENFDMAEPERPEFEGTDSYLDPISHQMKGRYPFHRRLLKYITSISVLLFMVCVVFISVSAVILYRVYSEVNICDKSNARCRFIHGTVIASLLNIISIMILGKIYELLAFKLTEWENHQTQSAYNDALIIKLFAFQFANTYTSLFYTAFFRKDLGSNGLFGLGPQYEDNCGDDNSNDCMSLLSFQLLLLMIMKPFLKFFKDIVWPFLKRVNRKCCGLNEIANSSVKQHYLMREMMKPQAEDFRLSEFTEKIVQYGYLMLFAASFPLAPLLALIFNTIDLRVDAKRLLWWNRRPTPYRDNDIGIWFYILHFINICGTMSNACIIAFTSSFGRNHGFAGKLLIVLIFEHLVFAVKFLLDLAIPDVPEAVKRDRKRDRFVVAHFMSAVADSSERSEWAKSRLASRRCPVHPNGRHSQDAVEESDRA